MSNKTCFSNGIVFFISYEELAVLVRSCKGDKPLNTCGSSPKRRPKPRPHS